MTPGVSHVLVEARHIVTAGGGLRDGPKTLSCALMLIGTIGSAKPELTAPVYPIPA